MQYLNVCTEHLPQGVYFCKYKLVIQNLYWENENTNQETNYFHIFSTQVFLTLLVVKALVQTHTHMTLVKVKI